MQIVSKMFEIEKWDGLKAPVWEVHPMFFLAKENLNCQQIWQFKFAQRRRKLMVSLSSPHGAGKRRQRALRVEIWRILPHAEWRGRPSWILVTSLGPSNAQWAKSPPLRSRRQLSVKMVKNILAARNLWSSEFQSPFFLFPFILWSLRFSNHVESSRDRW